MSEMGAGRERKEAGKTNPGRLARSIMNLQDAVPHGAASGRESRSKEDGASSEGVMRSQNLGGNRTASRRVDLLEEERIGIGSESLGGTRDGMGRATG